MKKLFAILPVSLLCVAAPLTSVATLKNATTYGAQDKMHEFLRVIHKLDKGVKLTGTVTQGRAEAVSFDPIAQDFVYGNAEDQNYGVDVYFENGDRTGTGLIHRGNLGELETVIDEMIVYEDEEGYCFNEYLDHTNSIQRNYKLEDGNKMSFGASGLYNIFTILDDSDYSYNERAFRYDVDLDKVSIITKNLLGHQNVGFINPVHSAFMQFNESTHQIVNFQIVMDPLFRFEEDKPVKYMNKVVFKISDIGTCELPKVEKIPAKPENQILNTALKKINDNFELTMEENISVNDAEAVPSYTKFKFNGEQIYVHKYSDVNDAETRLPNDYVLKTADNSDKLFARTYNEETGEFDKKDTIPGFAKTFQGIYFYEDLLPRANEVSTDFFQYDADTNEYVCRLADVLPQITRLFYIPRAPFLSDHIDNASKIGIRLTNSGLVDYVKYYVNYMDPFNATKNVGEIILNYSHIGETQF